MVQLPSLIERFHQLSEDERADELDHILTYLAARQLRVAQAMLIAPLHSQPGEPIFDMPVERAAA